VTPATETVSIIAVLIICVILAIYLTILRRNGWLGGSDKFYRCPNPECKKIFRTPAKVKDLSETPHRIHYSCPECGTDVEPFLKSDTSKETTTEAKPKQPATPKPIYLKQKPEVQTTAQHSAPKSTYLEQKSETQPATPSQIQIKEPQPKQTDQTLKPDITEDNQKTTESSGCQYYFGYLGNRQKNEAIPETCLACPNSLDCMLSKHKLTNSVQEMKKWYPPQS
jgi:FtsZ-interacting cell division protein ZipA